jgi:hypothetical protein
MLYTMIFAAVIKPSWLMTTVQSERVGIRLVLYISERMQ